MSALYGAALHMLRRWTQSSICLPCMGPLYTCQEDRPSPQYVCPVWGRSTHAKKMDPVLNMPALYRVALHMPRRWTQSSICLPCMGPLYTCQEDGPSPQYVCPVWGRSTHAKKMDPVLNMPALYRAALHMPRRWTQSSICLPCMGPLYTCLEDGPSPQYVCPVWDRSTHA